MLDAEDVTVEARSIVTMSDNSADRSSGALALRSHSRSPWRVRSTRQVRPRRQQHPARRLGCRAARVRRLAAHGRAFTIVPRPSVRMVEQFAWSGSTAGAVLYIGPRTSSWRWPALDDSSFGGSYPPGTRSTWRQHAHPQPDSATHPATTARAAKLPAG